MLCTAGQEQHLRLWGGVTLKRAFNDTVKEPKPGCGDLSVLQITFYKKKKYSFKLETMLNIATFPVMGNCLINYLFYCQQDVPFQFGFCISLACCDLVVLC